LNFFNEKRRKAGRFLRVGFAFENKERCVIISKMHDRAESEEEKGRKQDKRGKI
jgi:hypothetical protein